MSPTPAPVAKHPRQLIREAVVALLLSKTDAGTRVWPSRVRHVSSRDLPAIGVYTTEESSPLADASPRKYERTVNVVVDCLVEKNDALDDALDALAKQVEDLLMADPTLGGTASDSALMRTTIGLVGEGRTESGCASLEFEADYETSPGLVDADTLDDFAVAGVDMDLAPADGTPEIQDVVIIQDLPDPDPEP
ncbi:MAG: hypothetical protein KKF77_03000 [Proteobacteria bacterium]|nr:hypothetical protein [Pseudomonadota bacterium]